MSIILHTHTLPNNNNKPTQQLSTINKNYEQTKSTLCLDERSQTQTEFQWTTTPNAQYNYYATASDSVSLPLADVALPTMLVCRMCTVQSTVQCPTLVTRHIGSLLKQVQNNYI